MSNEDVNSTYKANLQMEDESDYNRETIRTANTSMPANADNEEQRIHQLQQELQEAVAGKRILYTGLKKIALELKASRAECRSLKSQSQSSQQSQQHSVWYEHGMWRSPQLLNGIMQQYNTSTNSNNNAQYTTKPMDVSLSDLFLDLATVTAFTRVGVAIQRNSVTTESICYLVLFWILWTKEAAYSTRFDTTDLSARVQTLVTCFAILFGSLSTTASLDSRNGGTTLMVVALFLSTLHLLLHARVWLSTTTTYYSNSRNHNTNLQEIKATRSYATYIMTMSLCESITWCTGIFWLPVHYRHYLFLFAFLFSLRLPTRTTLPNDFYAACSKRGVLFILLLGFSLQSIVMVATPFFDYNDQMLPNQYGYMGATCFLLFCIKLLYVDDTFSIDPSDHAVLVCNASALCFHLGQLLLLLSTTILGAGLDLLTHSFLASTTALTTNAKSLVCGGFSGVIFSIGFIKLMHLRRLPTNPKHERLFYAAYMIQVLVTVTVVYVTAYMCINTHGDLGNYYLTEIQLVAVLSFLVFFTLVISWLDEALEINLYHLEFNVARQYRIEPFGLWSFCLPPGETESKLARSLSQHVIGSRKSVSSLNRCLSSTSSTNSNKMMRNYSSSANMKLFDSNSSLYHYIHNDPTISPNSGGGGINRSSQPAATTYFTRSPDANVVIAGGGIKEGRTYNSIV